MILQRGTGPTPRTTGGAGLVIVGLPFTLQKGIDPILPITAVGDPIIGLLAATIREGTDPILPTTFDIVLLIGLLAILQRGADPTTGTDLVHVLCLGTVTGDHQSAGEIYLTLVSALVHLTVGVITARCPAVLLWGQEGQVVPLAALLQGEGTQGDPSHAAHLPGEGSILGATLAAAVQAHVLEQDPSLALHHLEERARRWALSSS